MSTGKFLAGFVVGAALGAISGILLAPKSGEETREILKDTTKDVLERTDAKIKNIQEKAETVVSDMQKKGDEIMEKIQNLISSTKEETKEEV